MVLRSGHPPVFADRERSRRYSLVRRDGSATEDLAAVVGDLEMVMRRVAGHAVGDAVRAAVG